MAVEGFTPHAALAGDIFTTWRPSLACYKNYGYQLFSILDCRRSQAGSRQDGDSVCVGDSVEASVMLDVTAFAKRYAVVGLVNEVGAFADRLDVVYTQRLHGQWLAAELADGLPFKLPAAE